MYLIVVAIATPGWQVSAGELRTALYRTAAETSLLEHDYLEVRSDEILVSLYLRTADQVDAELLAAQLCQATMTALAAPGDWRVRSVRSIG